MIKSRKMRWAAHIAGTGRIRMHIGLIEKVRKKETTRKT
jgi:hypothetical protein